MSKREKIMKMFNTLHSERNEINHLHDKLKEQQRYVDYLYKFGKIEDYELSIEYYIELQEEILCKINKLNKFRNLVNQMN